MEKKIPIVYVLDNFFRGGGTENQLANLIDNLDRDKFTPYVFNLRPKWKDIEINCDVHYMDVESVSIKNPFPALKAIGQVADFVRKVKAPIVHVFFFDSRIVGTLAARRAGFPLVVYSRREMGYWYTRFSLMVSRWLARRSDYCLVNANSIKRMVSETEMFPGSRIEVVYNGVELKPESNSTPLTKSDFGIPEDAPVVGIVANLRPVKRVDRFIEAASLIKNKDVHFLIIGGDTLGDVLKKQVEDLGLSDRIHFRHVVGVYHVLKLFDVGVLSSQSEGLSNVLIEYALAGVPSVTFNVGGNREVVLNNETGFIVPNGQVEEMAEKIEQLLEDPELRCRMGKKASEIAQDKFDIKNMARKTEDFYNKIIEEKNNARKEGGISKMKKAIKQLIFLIFYILVLPAGLSSLLFRKLTGSQSLYHFFAEGLSLVPGLPGIWVRRAFYNQTLKKASWDMVVLFGAFFTKMETIVEKNVRIGGYCTIGLAHLEENVTISSHSILLSGRQQHDFSSVKEDVLEGQDTFERLRIGQSTFVGEASLVTADIGEFSIIGAAAVVVKPIPDYVVAVGNPAKIIKERPRE